MNNYFFQLMVQPDGLLLTSHDVGTEQPKESRTIALPALLDGSLESAEREIGEAVLNAVAARDPDAFKELPTFSKFVTDKTAPESIAHDLIRISIKSKTTAYLSAIETLLTQDETNESAISFARESWPVIKQKIESAASQP